MICCWPWYKRVSHVVTQKAVRFNAPVANCPTKDNVLVDIDVSFNFQIFDADTFVMLMGAGRFQELLRVETEEAIRTLVYTREVLSLRDTTTNDEHTASIQRALNRSVIAYGVKITNIRITKVDLPETLHSEMSEQTHLKAIMITMEKEHKRDLEKMVNKTDRQNIETRKRYERDCDEQSVEVVKETEIRQTKLQQINATLEQQVIAAQSNADARITAGSAKLRDARTRADQKAIEVMNVARIASEETLNRCDRDVQKGIVNAKADAASRVTDAKSRLQKSETTSAKRAIKIVNDATIGAEKTIRAAEQEVQGAMAQAKGIRSIGQSKSFAIIAEMEAEEMGAESMKEARLQEVELERLEILNTMATTGNVMLTGKRAAQVMDYLAPTGQDKATEFVASMRSDTV